MYAAAGACRIWAGTKIAAIAHKPIPFFLTLTEIVEAKSRLKPAIGEVCECQDRGLVRLSYNRASCTESPPTIENHWHAWLRPFEVKFLTPGRGGVRPASATAWISSRRRLDHGIRRHPNFVYPPRHRMSWFKKLKKSRQSSKLAPSLGVPSNAGAVPPTIDTELDLDVGSEGALRDSESMVLV